MSEFYWPSCDNLGVYDLVHHSGAVWRDAMWTGGKWVAKGPLGSAIEPLEVISWGYLGVRREPAKPDDNATFAASVMAKLRAAKKPGEFERIALGDVPELCRRLGAR
jgi:hypothetical protein